MARPKFAQRIDQNQQDIVDALKAIGCDVEVIGKPVDLLVGYRHLNFLVEIKNPYDKYYKGTKAQRDWIRDWRGQVRVVTTVDEAIKLVTEAYIRINDPSGCSVEVLIKP